MKSVKTMWSILVFLLITAIGVGTVSAQDCESLTGLDIADVTITSSTIVPPGLFFPPVQDQYPYPISVEFCRVIGVITPAEDSSINFEVWMPTYDWNGKFMAVGNGGLGGSIQYTPGASFDMASSLLKGYATAATDTGHTGAFADGLWAIGHPEKVIDFAYRAVHETTITAKEIINAFYGTYPGLSYFSGCSQGGRQGLLEAQRYPEDYDGIVAGAPAHDFTHLVVAGVSLAQVTLSDFTSYIPASKLPAISDAVLATCDGIDGLIDGLVDDPRECSFDPYSLLCPGDENDSCLTYPQAFALEHLYKDVRNSITNAKIYPGLEPGGELTGYLGWDVSITGPAPGYAVDIALSSGFMKGAVYEDPYYNVLTFDFGDDMTFMDDKLAAMINAVDPDLSAFRARGGKLLMYHGWSDAVIPPQTSIDYYKAVKNAIGSMDETITFARLFMAPGMHHCIGGTGPSAFDAISALEYWREYDYAPDQIIAAHLTPDRQVDRTRPLCRYPLVARYNGTGSIDDFWNFTCVEN